MSSWLKRRSSFLPPLRFWTWSKEPRATKRTWTYSRIRIWTWRKRWPPKVRTRWRITARWTTGRTCSSRAKWSSSSSKLLRHSRRSSSPRRRRTWSISPSRYFALWQLFVYIKSWRATRGPSPPWVFCMTRCTFWVARPTKLSGYGAWGKSPAWWSTKDTCNRSTKSSSPPEASNSPPAESSTRPGCG